MVEQIGAIIEEGPEDWQIVQQMNGVGRMELGGRWKFDGEGKIEVRLVWEDTGVAVTSGLDWQVATTKDDGMWGAVLEKIPAGGLYRLETRLRVGRRFGCGMIYVFLIARNYCSTRLFPLGSR
jgi:hypothetical protein